MYRLNELQKNVLITVDEVIFHAQTKHTLDPRTIENAIIIAEERFLRTALGYDFYEVLIAQKNRVVTDINKADLSSLYGSELVVGQIVNATEFLSADNQDLWKQMLWKLTAECVMLSATPASFVQFTSEGSVHGAPPAGPMTTNGVVTPELAAIKWTMDKKLMDMIAPLTASLHAWICRNKSRYPAYDKHCDCDENGVAYKRKTNIILDIYEDDDKCGCR